MISKRLPQVLVFSCLAFLLAVAQPAAALSSASGGEHGAGLWAEVRALFADFFGGIRSGEPAGEKPSLVLANVGAGLDPDGMPAAGAGGGAGAANSHANESH